MFQGFNESTVNYFEAIRRENSKINYKANEQYYFEGVKEPLEGYRYGMSIYKPETKDMEKIREYFWDNKYSAIDAVKRFNKAGLLELQGDVYKRDNYPEADAVLKPILERKRLAFVKESTLDEAFFSRKLLDNMMAAYDSVTDIFQLMKEAL